MAAQYIKNLLLFVSLLVIFSSCTKHIYMPAMFSNDISYQPKPASFDTAKSAFYVSAGFGTGIGANLDDELIFGELNISQAYVFNGFNLSYGAFGYAGGLNNSSYNSSNSPGQPYNFPSKGFWGYGGRASINAYEHSGNTDIRYIGLETSYSQELGDFAAFRRNVNGLDNYYSDAYARVFTAGLTSEILWHSRTSVDTQFGVRGLIGGSFYNNVYMPDNSSGFSSGYPLYLSGSFFAQFNKFFGVAEISKGLNFFPNFRLKIGKKF